MLNMLLHLLPEGNLHFQSLDLLVELILQLVQWYVIHLNNTTSQMQLTAVHRAMWFC